MRKLIMVTEGITRALLLVVTATVISMCGYHNICGADITCSRIDYSDPNYYIEEYEIDCTSNTREMEEGSSDYKSWYYNVNLDNVYAISIQASCTYTGCQHDKGRDIYVSSNRLYILVHGSEGVVQDMGEYISLQGKFKGNGQLQIQHYLKRGLPCPQCGNITEIKMHSSGFKLYRLRNVPTPTPTATPTPVPTQNPTPTPTPVPIVTPTPVPTQIPTPTPTSTPVPTVTPTPVPTVAPGEQPQKTEVLPSGNSSSSYAPSHSSSQYVLPAGSGGTGSSGNGGTSNGAASSNNPSSANTTYSASTSHYSDSSQAKLTSDLPGYKSTISQKSTSGKSEKDESRNSSSSVNTLSNSGKVVSDTVNGRKTIMKNGVLYVCDDETETSEGDFSGQTALTEEFELENAYSQGDLQVQNSGEISKDEKVFWETPAGVAAGAGIVLAALLILMFVLFFGVVVLGEIEENDEVYDLCAIRLVRRKDGNWYVNLKEVFEENAAVKLKLGILFAVIFKEWELTGNTTGNYAGCVKGEVSQNMMLYRKKIRRNV